MTDGSASLRRGALYVLLGNGVFNACRLIAAPILIAKCASSAVLGQYEYGLALAAPVVLFFSLELRSVFVSDTVNRFAFSVYRVARNAGLSVAAFVLTGVVGWNIAQSQPTGAELTGGVAVAILIGACALRIAFQAAEVHWGVYQRRERLDLFGWSNALRGFWMLISFAACLLAARYGMPERAAGATALAIWLTIAGWFLIGRAFDHRNTADAGPSADWSWSQVFALARLALPLGCVALIISLCESVPRWFIRASDDGLRELGRFGALAYLPMAVHFVVLQLALAASRRLALHFSGDRRAFMRLALRLISISICLGVLVFATIWSLGPGLLRVVYTPEYAALHDAFLVLVAGQCIILPASVFGYVLTQMRAFWVQVPVHLIVFAATVAAAWRWIPADAVEGGAWTMVVRAISQTALYAACFVVLAMRRPVNRGSA